MDKISEDILLKYLNSGYYFIGKSQTPKIFKVPKLTNANFENNSNNLIESSKKRKCNDINKTKNYTDINSLDNCGVIKIREKLLKR